MVPSPSLTLNLRGPAVVACPGTGAHTLTHAHARTHTHTQVASRRAEEQEEYALLGPGGAGFAETEKGQQKKQQAADEAAARKACAVRAVLLS